MAQINPKLNLNKTPSLVENNSLIFAKNIRLDVDTTIHRDYGVIPLSFVDTETESINYDKLINRIVVELKNKVNTDVYNNLLNISTLSKSTSIKNSSYKIVGIIPNTDEFYLCVYGSYTISNTNKTCSYIIRYDEITDKFSFCKCNWKYSGGKITGSVINNLLGEKILTIGEYDVEDKLIPLKCINLNKSDVTDDETIYTQTPNIPITNLNYVDDFSYIIPNGVYQFFIRYKIRNDFYTDWFPATKELFAGNQNTIVTSFGTAKYVNTHRDSDKSFVFNVNHLFNSYNSNYESFQLGFIISHDEQITARAWKHFKFGTEVINFDYNAKDATEIEIIDLIKHSYQIFNVGNITSFKNKLYISNYKETAFNEKNLQSYADAVSINIKQEAASAGLAGNPILTTTVNGREMIEGVVLNNHDTYFRGQNGLFDKLWNTKNNGYQYTVKEILSDTLGNNEIYTIGGGGSYDYGLASYVNRPNLNIVKEQHRNNYVDTDEDKYSNFNYEDDVYYVYINNHQITEEDGDFYENVLNYLLNFNIYLYYQTSPYKNLKVVNQNGADINTIKIEVYRKFTYTHRFWDTESLPPDENPTPPVTGDGNEQEKDPNGGEDHDPNDKTEGHWETENVEDTYKQEITLNLQAFVNEFSLAETSALTNCTTLIPYQKYKFFIHFVKQSGEITNGYYCGGENAGIKEAPYKSVVDSVIYPSFNCPYIPSGYVSYFFSIVHVENITATVCDISTDNNFAEATCLDINLNIFPGMDNIVIKQGDNSTDTGKWFYSGDSSNILYFGANGVLTWDKDAQISKNSLAYAVSQYSAPEIEDFNLIKCTPFISSIGVFEDYNNMNLLGYICKIYPLDKNKTIKYYTDGSSSVYKKTTTGSSGVQYFSLVELKTYLGDANQWDEKITELSLQSSPSFSVYSNYNLNYLTLTENPKESYKTYYNTTSDDTSTKQPNTLILRLFSSLEMSNVYTLPSMYKKYIRKTYSKYTDSEITEFNNTIRSSELEGDENSINIFKFNANDYYNVPTNRGIIVNLVAIGDAVLVHTKDSMFKFSGSNNLQSSEGEIQTTESQIFDTGVAEIFGSDFGFAGLQTKTDHIITENGYIFFDRDSRIVYLYSGNGQIMKVSDSIEKLFRHKDIRNIYFANDYYNNRFFMSIMFVENGVDYPVTLSFSTLDKAKNFVSLHDFYFLKAFNTKSKCYFLNDVNDNICNINKKYKSCYSILSFVDKTYPSQEGNLIVQAKDYVQNITKSYDLKDFDSIIDVIDNQNFEDVKTLNYIEWCGNVIEEEFKDININDISTLKMAEDINSSISCKNLRIYTDTCMTPLNDFTIRSNDYNINSLNSYMRPRYNQGKWAFNYFRNIQNSNGNINPYVSDENSLIEGKYFVVRFVYDSDFKLETLNLNYSTKQ